MAGKIEYKKKSIVSTRQLYRRIGVDTQDTLKEMRQQKQVSQKTQVNSKKKYKHSINNTDTTNYFNDDNAINISAVNFNHNLTNDQTNVSEAYDCVSRDFNNENTLFNNLVHKSLIEAFVFMSR